MTGLLNVSANARGYSKRGSETMSKSVTDTAAGFKTSLPLRKGSDGFDTQQDYLIKGYLPASSVASAYGASGSYKSFTAVSWGCHIATGKPWAGKPVTQGAVIYVVGEGGIGVPAVSGHGNRHLTAAARLMRFIASIARFFLPARRAYNR